MPQAQQAAPQTDLVVYTVEESGADDKLIRCHFDKNYLPLVGIDYGTINVPIDERKDEIHVRGDARRVLRQVLMGLEDIVCDIKSLQVIGNSILEVRVKNAEWRPGAAKHLREVSGSAAVLNAES